MGHVLLILLAFLAALIVIVLPPGKGEVSPFYDESGRVIPDSVAEKRFLEVDDGKIGMILLAKDKTKPVLLVCGGGPGIPQYLLESLYPSGLADEFVVCYMEYRGTGLSYSADICAEDMTTDRYIADVLAVTEYLKKRFSQEKIYILGHSFGTYIAVQTVQRYPEHYQAYFAMSQICDQKESEYQAYDYMKEQYEKAGNKKMVRKFEQYPIQQSEEIYEKYMTSSLRDTAMHGLGVGTARNMKSVISGIFFPSLRCSAYTPQERINIWRGKLASADFPVTEDAIHFNAFSDAKSLPIPVYFFAGQYDRTCCYSLQKKYYEMVDAPEKYFYTFEESAHSPLYEEPEKAEEIFKNILEEAD